MPSCNGCLPHNEPKIELDIIIRKGEPKDFQQVLSLIREFSVFQKTPEKVSITLERMHAAGSLFQLRVAETAENEIIRFASYFFAWYSWSGKTLYLDDLYVREGFRKKGIGRRLLNAVIQVAKEEECVKVRWQVSKWNVQAIEYYLKIGASIDDVEWNCELIV